MKKTKMLEAEVKGLKQEIENIKYKEVEGYLSAESLLKASGVSNTSTVEDTNRIGIILNDKIFTTVIGLFDYENLPEELPFEVLEDFLYYNGKCVFFQLAGKYYVSKYSSDGRIDVYGRPLKVQPMFANGRVVGYKEVDKNCVIMKNSPTAFSTFLSITPYLDRLSLNWEMAMQRLRVSMTKWLVQTDQKDVGQVRAELTKLINGNGFVAVTKKTLDKIEQFPFFSEFKASEIWEDYNNTLAHMYSSLGIESNFNEDKKERMIVDEVNISNAKTNTLVDAMFKQRQSDIDKINKMFGLDIKLVLKNNFKEEEEDESDNVE